MADLTRTQLDATVARASILAKLGVGTSPLEGTPFAIADLSGRRLGLACSHAMTTDIDAAGHGWSLDDLLDADAVDLLSVVLHEFGHELGLGHREAHFMAALIGLGERRLPDIEDLDALLADLD